MRNLLTEIDSYLARGTLVFPSEIAAEFWRHAAIRDSHRAAIRDSHRAAIREDQVISWDTFKEHAFAIREEAIPTNRTIRAIFAERVIRENAASPFLTALIPQDFAAEAGGFSATIESVLPRIPAALAAMRRANHQRFAALRADIGRLRDLYESFMREHGLFEPRWIGTAPRFTGGDYLLIAPGLADDFPEFEPAVAAVPRFDPGTAIAAGSGTELVVYENGHIELRAVLEMVARLLDDGVDPEQIVLTVGDLETLGDRLEQFAERYQIPLVMRAGRPLSESAVGRFVRDIGTVVSSGFSVGALERLVLNRAVPWRGGDGNAALVIRGVEQGALGGPRPDPRWRRVERDGGGVSNMITGLRNILPAITGAGSFADLRAAFNRLLSQLVSRDGWAPADERQLERSQEELRELAAVEEDSGLRVEDPYRFWLARLAERTYVAQVRETGVAVLPYRVGAAICPEHHLVMNATHSATAVVTSPFPFMSDAQREDIGPAAAERDLSAAFLNAYSVSGQAVTFTASRSTFEGSALPAGHFVSTGSVRKASPQEVTRARDGDPTTLEETDIDAYAESAGPVTRLQAMGACNYLRGARTGGADFTRDPISDPEVREAALRRLFSRSAPDLVSLSASNIDLFRSCPYSFLLSRGLGVEELTTEVVPDSPREFGGLYHDILATFFERLGSNGGRFRAQELAANRQLLSKIADRLYAERRGMIPDIVYESDRETFSRIADALLDHDALMIDGHEPLLTESWKKELETADGYVLVGRVDRVTRSPAGGLTLVDYKKSRLPSRRAVHGGSPDPVGLDGISEVERAQLESWLESVQIPIYVKLLERDGERVCSAGYYSLENGTYLSVFSEDSGSADKPCMTRERMDEVMILVEGIAASVASRIRAGDFTCNEECHGCAFRTVCRTRFYVQ